MSYITEHQSENKCARRLIAILNKCFHRGPKSGKSGETGEMNEQRGLQHANGTLYVRQRLYMFVYFPTLRVQGVVQRSAAVLFWTRQP